MTILIIYLFGSFYNKAIYQMNINVRKLQYRRLRRTNSQIQNRANQEKTDEDKIINLMDIMIKHIKTQFATVFQFRKIINQSYDKKTFLNKSDRMQSLYQQVKVAPDIEISQLQISTEVGYFRMFYFRLAKEISYYINNMKLAHILLQNIEEIMQNQLEKQTHPIIYIFRFTRNKLLIELQRLYKIFIDICKLQEEKKQQQPEDSLKKRIRFSIRRKQTLTMQFNDFLEKFQNTFYSCLDLECIQVTNLYLPSVSISANIDLISRKQIKRNKRIKKDVKAYKLNYQNYQQKRDRAKSKYKTPKISASKLRQKTESIDASDTLFPSIKPQKDSNFRDSSKQITQNKLSKKFSFQKNLKTEDKENHIFTKEISHMASKQFHRQNFRLKLQTLDNYKKAVQ